MAAEDVCEKGMLWLPSHVLDEICDTKTKVLVINIKYLITWYSLQII